MESAFVAVIALVALLGAIVALLSRQRLLPWNPPALRVPGGPDVRTPETDGDVRPDVARKAVPGATPEPSLPMPLATTRPSSVGRTSRHEQPIERSEPSRLEIVPAPNEEVAARLDRIEKRLDELHRAIRRQGEELAAETGRVRTELAMRMDTEEARRDAAQERLRADVLSAVSGLVVNQRRDTGDRRPEVSAELYARLARLEAALATVTNPVLLPGETYAPPPEFLPEALIWENWNEVGERAFALADSFSAQRLHLSEQTRADLGGFVTSLRTLLTRSVYPNLQPEPDPMQQAALRAALEEIATELPRVRGMLEMEYREGRSA